MLHNGSVAEKKVKKSNFRIVEKLYKNIERDMIKEKRKS